jgi:DNA adenine methylase
MKPQLSPVTHPAVKWFGAKFNYAPWIIAHFPKHRTYVEPFGGGAGVLLRKLPSEIEIYNDLDECVVNLFRVLRDPITAADLKNKLRLTPFARQELKDTLALEMSPHPVENARRLLVLALLGNSQQAANPDGAGRNPGFHGWREHTAKEFISWQEGIDATIERIRTVTIENVNAVKLMKHRDSPTTLFYVDPPYLLDKVSSMRLYKHTMTVEQHVELLTMLRALKGKVVVSMYEHPVYDKGLRGWKKVTRRFRVDRGRWRVECLWLNPAVATERFPFANGFFQEEKANDKSAHAGKPAPMGDDPVRQKRIPHRNADRRKTR